MVPCIHFRGASNSWILPLGRSSWHPAVVLPSGLEKKIPVPRGCLETALPKRGLLPLGRQLTAGALTVPGKA